MQSRGGVFVRYVEESGFHLICQVEDLQENKDKKLVEGQWKRDHKRINHL